jgi:hypothetical protein
LSADDNRELNESAAPDNAGADASAASDKAQIDNRARLREIRAVLGRHQITRGVTPEKLREILEDLVCEQTRQIIEAQASLFGFTAQAEVFCTYDRALGTFLPTRVTITAACTQTQKELLSDFLTQQLGIETEAQTWVTGS